MVYKSIDLNEDFDTKEEMIKAVFEKKADIIAFKKSIVYKSFEKGQLSAGLFNQATSKSILVKNGFIRPVINTTNFLDSHLDNHVKGLFVKSAKEQNGKIRYSLDHSTKIADVIAYPKDVQISIIDTTFKNLGYDYESSTQALIFDIDKTAIENDTALKVINKQLPVQNSVTMQYVQISLAINSEEEEYAEEFKTWKKHYPELANKEFADEMSIMWIVSEAKIVNESSMVTQGSNSITPILYTKDIEIPELTEEQKTSNAYKAWLGIE
jgi:hypothetical protein|tara:strand:- start:12842 stop:13645 length:804 start_codon:yes stop_codon:yes gene_type:complete